jgi:uncharacterized protein
MSDSFGNEADVIIDDDAGNRIVGASTRTALEYVVKAIVDDPDAVVVNIEEDGANVLFRVHVAADDKGKVIGRRGRVATAVRTVIRAVGSREDINVTVDIADD